MTQAKLFSDRQAFWAGQGCRGRDLYEQLAADPELPSHFTEMEVSAIAGLSTHAIKMRRVRGMKPAFLRVSTRCVRYPREAVCLWLADLYRAQEAA